MKSDLIDAHLHLRFETDGAVLAAEDQVSMDTFWLPKSQCDVGDAEIPGMAVVAMPEWLALEKGLI